jgi:DNA processing protein
LIKNDIELFSLLQLQNTKGLGCARAKQLIDHWQSAEQVLCWARKKSSNRPPWVRELVCLENERRANQEWDLIQKKGWKIFGYGLPDFPMHLKTVPDVPILLFAEGEADLSSNRMLSVVGTRRMTPYGAGFCRELIQELSPYRPTIVSGFAEGIDITAQMEAVRLGLPTVACLAHGLLHLYPTIHRPFKKAVLGTGNLLTEFWSEQKAQRFQFVQRNRIIAGLSSATLVVQSAQKGGSLLTADMANGYHREVFAVPGRIGDPQSRGCLELIRDQKAQLISEPKEVVDFLQWTPPKGGIMELPKENLPLKSSRWNQWPKTEQSILIALLENGKMTQHNLMHSLLAERGPFLEALLKLELAQEIRPLPGQMWALNQ